MEISRTSLWGFYCRKDASWTQIKTDWEYLWGLKIIKSWRFHFSKQKISTIGQAICTSFSYYLFRKIFFDWTPKILREKLSRIIYPRWSQWFLCCQNLRERYQFLLFFDVEVSLNDYSSPLHMQNKTSSRTTLVQFFSFDLFGGTAKPQNRWGK